MYQPTCFRTICERAAAVMLNAKPAPPPTARSGRLVLTLLFMLLTTASAWAKTDPTLHVNIHYVGLTADDATVAVTYTYMGKRFEETTTKTVTDDWEATLNASSKAVSVAVTSENYDITTAFSAATNYAETIDVTKDGNNCSFTAHSTHNTTLDITIKNTVTSVTATKGANAPYSIGKGAGSGTCGTVTIGDAVGAISESPYTYQP